jgi:hypothetical protein
VAALRAVSFLPAVNGGTSVAAVAVADIIRARIPWATIKGALER